MKPTRIVLFTALLCILASGCASMGVIKERVAPVKKVAIIGFEMAASLRHLQKA